MRLLPTGMMLCDESLASISLGRRTDHNCVAHYCGAPHTLFAPFSHLSLSISAMKVIVVTVIEKLNRDITILILH